ncbi:MAG: patatin-like phospholipase family protein [Bacteroidota bacterium]
MAHTPAYTILSLDGGGIRGIIPCKVLMYVEKKLAELAGGEGPRLAEVFDLMAGTSTGGMIACGLAVKGEDGRPKFAAEDLLKIYTGNTGQRIFKKPMRFGLSNFFRSLARAKFPADNIEAVLYEYFGDAKLSETLTDLLITSYNTEEKKPFYFKSSDCRANPEVEDFLIREVGRSTSAAPTYFPPKMLKYQGLMSFFDKHFQKTQKQLDKLSLIDGGVFANNPAVLAYIEAKNHWRKLGPLYAERMARSASPIPVADDDGPELVNAGEGPSLVGGGANSRSMFAEQVIESDEELPFLMLSIGTGNTGTPYPYQDVAKWGMVDWVLPLIDILMQGVSETVDYQMQHLLPPYQDGTKRYLRFNIKVEPEHSEMDDPRPQTTEQLEAYGQAIVDNPENKAELDAFCEALYRRYQGRQTWPTQPTTLV